MSTSTIVSSVSRGNHTTHPCFSLLLLVADLYIVLYDAIREGKAGHGCEGLYFGENGEHRMRDIAASIAEALHDLAFVDMVTKRAEERKGKRRKRDERENRGKKETVLVRVRSE
jgi:hypothetical protein